MRRVEPSGAERHAQPSEAAFKVTGYSLRTDGFRYTAWCEWQGGPNGVAGCDWARPPYRRELYAHTDDGGRIDDDQENGANVAADGVARRAQRDGASAAPRAVRGRGQPVPLVKKKPCVDQEHV